MKYVYITALARLFGKALPSSVEYFTNRVKATLVKINAGMVRPHLAVAADVSLANNKTNKQGIWGLTMI